METPLYRNKFNSGELERIAALAVERLSSCDICPWQCGADRLSGELGMCQTGRLARVSSYGPHHGEEAPLSGTRGSGTIFFSRCNMKCQYCQNYEISQSDSGREVTPGDLAGIMLELQSYGCHNINFVSPSHVVPQILSALLLAAGNGLNIPLVYNSGGYDSVDTLRLLDGVIDIYMPDMKYADADLAYRFSGITHYPNKNQAAVLEMHRQVGDLEIDPQGLAYRGLLVRHLMLPNALSGVAEVAAFLAQKVSPDTYLNLMDQYRPCYRATDYPELNRRLYPEEYREAVRLAKSAGIYRLDR